MSNFGSGFGLAPALQQQQEPIPFAPSGAGLAPALRGELGNDADRERRLMDSFRESYNTDPNFAAEAQKFADELGASRATVAANMDVAKRMAVARSLRYQELKDKFPTLLEKFSNVKFASLAHDDVGNLKATESTWAWLGRQSDAGAAVNQRGYLGVRRALGWMTPDEQAEIDRLNVSMREAGQDSGIVAEGTRTIGQVADTFVTVLGSGAAAAGVASLGGPVSAGAAFTGASAAAAFTMSAMIEGGNAYEDMLAQGIDPQTARQAAFGVIAPVNGALEMVGMHYFAAPFKSAFAKLATKKVAGKLVSETAGSAFDRFARSYAKSYLSEIGTEVLQEAVSMSAGGVARASSRPDLPAMTWADIMGQLGEIAGKTAQGMLLPALPGPAFQFVGDSITARQSLVEQQFLKDAIAQQGESKVAKRAPNARLEFLAATARGSDGATTYVRTEAALDALRQDGLTIEDLSAKSPEIAAKLNEAREKGLESASFPTATYIGKLQGTTFGETLLPHLRLSEASMSLEELRQFAKDEPKRTAEAAALIEAYKATSAEWAQSSATVREDYRTSILQAGRSEQEASTVASFLTAFAETQAYGLGITPSEFVARFPLQVVRGAVAARETFQQTKTDSPEFRAWFGESKVVDEKGKPLVVYHGTNITFPSFDPERTGSSTDSGKLGAGIYFTEDSRIASSYATLARAKRGMSGEQVYPVFLSLKNPMVLSTDKGDLWSKLRAASAEMGIAEDPVMDRESNQPNPEWAVAFSRGLRERGFDGVTLDFGAGRREHMVLRPEQVKSVNNRGTFDPADPNILRQGDTKGTFDPKTLTIMLMESPDPSKSADASTLIHELGHFYLHVLAELATNPEATRAAADFQTFATWTGVKDVATWNAMSLEEQRPHHEAFARSFELFLYEGKAPSAELRTLFERFRAWLVSVYRDIVGQLNADYRAEFGRDLPALTPEVRGVMGRLVAADEAIAKAEAVRDMKPLFQTLEESGMTAEEFAAYEQSIAEAHEASVTDLGKASLRQMQWLTGARARLTKQLQSKNEKLRREAEREVEQTIAFEPVYRVERWLRRGELVSQDGKVEKEPGPDHKLNVAEVRKMLGLVVPEKLPKRAKERMERPVKRAKQRPKSMVTRIRELGGISRYSWETTYPGERRGEFKIKGVVRGKRGETAATSSGGMTWEDMAKALQSDGYGPQQGEEVDAADYSWFVDALTDAANGSPTYRESDYYAGENAEPDTRAPESPEERAARLEAEAESEAERAAIQSEEDLDAATVDPWDLGNTSPQDALLRLGYGKFGMLSKDGHGLDAVAEMFGFASGEQLLRELLTAPRLDARVAMEADALMLDRHGDMATPEAREAAVEEALHNEARMRFVATELRWLSKSTEPVRIMVQAAQEAAREAIAALPVRQLTPRTFALAEARSARLAAKEAKAGNMVEAVRAKRQQLLHSHMAAEALRARREVDTAKSEFKRFFRADEKLAKTRNVDFVNAGRAVLAWYGLGPKGDKPPGAYVKALREYNPTLYAEMEPTLARVVDTPRDYRDLTTDEFRALVVTVDALWDASKRSRQITVEGQKRELAEVTGEVLARLGEIGVPAVLPGEKADVTEGQRKIRGIHQIGAALKRVEHWADTLDGGKSGPFTRYVWRPVQQAIDAYRVQRNKVVKSYVDLLGTIEWTQGKIDAPELGYTFGTDNGGGGMETLLGALLHTGNTSNFRKLLLAETRRWGEVDAEGALVTTKWDAFIARMIDKGILTKKHFDWVQKVWDLTESLKPEAQKAWHEINGFYFKEVEADARTITFKDGSTATYRGGYVPAKVDGFLVRDADVHQKLAELEADFRNSQPSVAAGFGKSRVEGYTKALSLDVRKIAAHLDSVVRFIHVQPAIRSVLKVVNDRAVSATLSRVDSTAVNDLILPWLNRAAQQQTMEGDPSSLVNKFWNAVRKRTGMSAMFANLSNALQQVTGYFPAALKVAPRYLKGGLAAYAKDFKGTTAEVAKRSEFMATRLDNQTFEIADAMNDVLVNPTKFDKVKKWSDRHAYFLQSAFQNQVDVVTWLGAYNQSIEAQGAIDPATAEREAVQKADAAVRLTQGSRNPESLARFEASTPFVKLFTQFSGYFNMLANLNASEYRKLFRELGWGAFGRKGAGRLAMLYVLGFGAPTLIADAIAKSFAGKWDDEEGDGYSDDLAAWFFAANAKGAVSLIPGVGPAVNAVIRGVSSSSPYDDRMSLAPSITALEAATFGVAKTAENVAQGKLSGRNVRDVLTLLTLLTGVPVSALGKPIGYAMDANAGKFEPTGPVDYGRGMLTGIASEASKR